RELRPQLFRRRVRRRQRGGGRFHLSGRSGIILAAGENVRVILKPDLLVVLPESEAETGALRTWTEPRPDHVFHLAVEANGGTILRDLGARDDACREPINIVFDTTEARWQPISNLAFAPFELDGRSYASVEGFWQGLKSDDDAVRRRIAALAGLEAKNAGP